MSFVGSSIPPLYEGTPLRADSWILTFQPVGSISIGNVVTLTSGTNQGVAAGTANSQFLLGVALNTGGLAGGAQATFGAQGPTPIAVICRGMVDVIVDGATNAGDYLVPSATAGQVHDVGGGSTSISGLGIVRCVALTGAATAGSTIQALII